MKRKRERRFTSSPDKRAGGTFTRRPAVGEIGGYAAVFYNGTPATEYRMARGVVERIEPGAFAEALRSSDVVALFNHDDNLLLGRASAGTLKLEADSVGLWYSVKPGDTTIARDVREHLRRGDITRSSFGFLVGDDPWDRTASGGQVRWIVKVDRLFDVSPVTRPAYTGTSSGVGSQRDEINAVLRKLYQDRAREIERQVKRGT